MEPLMVSKAYSSMKVNLRCHSLFWSLVLSLQRQKLEVVSPQS